MAGKSYVVIWTKRAKGNMGKIYDYISRDSLQNAGKVVEDISAIVDKVPANPEIHSIDKIKDK